MIHNITAESPPRGTVTPRGALCMRTALHVVHNSMYDEQLSMRCAAPDARVHWV